MSMAEDICLKSLRMILKPEVQIVRNFRPDFLQNPKTGKNLEIDFYFPETKIGLEIQGGHHVDSDPQRERDEVKRDLCEKNDIALSEICLSQIGPCKLYRKLYNLSHAVGRKLMLEKFNRVELVDFDRKVVRPYLDALKVKFPESAVNFSVHLQRKLMDSRYVETTVESRRSRRRRVESAKE